MIWVFQVAVYLPQETFKGFTTIVSLADLIEENFEERIREVDDIAPERGLLKHKIEWKIVFDIEVKHGLRVIENFQTSNSPLRFHMNFNFHRLKIRNFLTNIKMDTLLIL